MVSTKIGNYRKSYNSDTEILEKCYFVKQILKGKDRKMENKDRTRKEIYTEGLAMASVNCTMQAMKASMEGDDGMAALVSTVGLICELLLENVEKGLLETEDDYNSVTKNEIADRLQEAKEKHEALSEAEGLLKDMLSALADEEEDNQLN